MLENGARSDVPRIVNTLKDMRRFVPHYARQFTEGAILQEDHLLPFDYVHEASGASLAPICRVSYPYIKSQSELLLSQLLESRLCHMRL